MAELEEVNKALVMRFDEAWSGGDVEALREILSPDLVWHLIYISRINGVEIEP